MLHAPLKVDHVDLDQQEIEEDVFKGLYYRAKSFGNHKLQPRPIVVALTTQKAFREWLQ